MTENEVQNYFEEWAKIGAVYEKGDYIDLFKTSDLMITDGCSFLAEYLPTGNPLIRPVNKNSVNLNALGKEISKGFYETKNNSEIQKLFNELLINKNDIKKEVRKEIANRILNGNKKSHERIFDLISQTVEGI